MVHTHINWWRSTSLVREVLNCKTDEGILKGVCFKYLKHRFYLISFSFLFFFLRLENTEKVITITCGHLTSTAVDCIPISRCDPPCQFDFLHLYRIYNRDFIAHKGSADPAPGSNRKQTKLPCRDKWQTVNHSQGQESVEFLKTWRFCPHTSWLPFFCLQPGPWSPAMAENLTSLLCHAALAVFITLSQIHLSSLSLLTVRPFHFCWLLLSTSKSTGHNVPAAELPLF